jgi:predicted lysophospholipase L1 biosynthesis ABC-type transport system permease subunit
MATPNHANRTPPRPPFTRPTTSGAGTSRPSWRRARSTTWPSPALTTTADGVTFSTSPGLFGLLGLVISSVGIYVVMAYTVSQRTREIGVRMALGATRSNVVAMMLANACGLVAAGLVIGGISARYLSMAAKAFLFRLDATDPRAFGAALASLAMAALAASAIRRAGRLASIRSWRYGPSSARAELHAQPLNQIAGGCVY